MKAVGDFWRARIVKCTARAVEQSIRELAKIQRRHTPRSPVVAKRAVKNSDSSIIWNTMSRRALAADGHADNCLLGYAVYVTRVIRVIPRRG